MDANRVRRCVGDAGPQTDNRRGGFGRATGFYGTEETDAMYTMVMMMAVAGSADTASFGWKKNSCHGGAVVAGCHGAIPAYAGCHGSGYLPSYTGCHGAYAGCYGSSCYGERGGFLGLRGNSCDGGRGGFLGLRGGRGYSCHGGACHGVVVSHGCHGAVDCCGAHIAHSTGCVGSVVTGAAGAAMPAPAAEGTPNTPAKDTPKTTGK
jgi:hypothetical protein